MAVAQNGNALEFASESLQEYPEVVKMAMAQDGNALQYDAKSIRQNPEVVKMNVCFRKEFCGTSLLNLLY